MRPANADDEPIQVSLIRLIANPQRYDGKLVQVIGFVSLEFEGHGVFLHREDYLHNINKNGLWIDVSDEIMKKKAEFDQKVRAHRGYV